MAGSNMQGPIICTASPQFVCGYSNGFPLATSISGARRMKFIRRRDRRRPGARANFVAWRQNRLLHHAHHDGSQRGVADPAQHAGQWSQTQPEGRYSM